MKTKTQEQLEKDIEQMKKDFEETENNLPKGMKLSKAELFELMGKLSQHLTDIKNFEKLINKKKKYWGEHKQYMNVIPVCEEIKEALKEL